MEKIESITVTPFGDGLLVLIKGDGGLGKDAAVTINCDFAGSNRTEVVPKDEIHPDYKERVNTALSERGYSLVEQSD